MEALLASAGQATREELVAVALPVIRADRAARAYHRRLANVRQRHGYVSEYPDHRRSDPVVSGKNLIAAIGIKNAVAHGAWIPESGVYRKRPKT